MKIIKIFPIIVFIFIIPFHFPLSSLNAAIPDNERSALIDLYNTCNGDNWVNNSGWLGEPGSECNWFGIYCNPEKTNIERLELRGPNVNNKFGIKGEIPKSIKNLLYVNRINFESNNITKIPPEIGYLTHLTSLNLHYNSLQALPTEIGDLTNLTYLHLGDNKITSIPSEIGYLTKLKNLNLRNNEIINIPKEIGNLKELQTLYLLSNKLTNLPKEIGNLVNLTHLYLNSNDILDLPSEIGNLNKLTYLSLSSNKLSNIPSEIGNLTNLSELYMSSLNLESMPSEIFNLSNLTYFSLDDNNLESIPLEIGNLTNLTDLTLSANDLSSIPTELFDLINLKYLNLSNNNLDSIPLEIGKLINLNNLILSNNDIINIPVEISNLINLQYFNLSSNNLNTLPSEIGKLTSLTVLILFDNELTSLPSAIENLKNLTSLTLSKNKITNIPTAVLNMTHLIYLTLSKNYLTSLPDEIKNLQSLNRIDLSDNKLNTLSPEIGNLTKLYYLKLENNDLSSVPPDISKLTNLNELDISNNSLTSIPNEIGNLKNLSTLYLYSNQLKIVPPEIGNLEKLTRLLLLNNKLNNLPSEIGRLKNLTYLDLSFNDLKNLPNEIGNLESLTSLSLANNNLGVLPSEIGKLQNLIYLDLSSIDLKNIPPEVWNLKNITSFALSNSDLTYIPTEIWNFHNLGYLNLSSNKIATIPPEIGNLTNLTYLCISGNKISSIPSEITNLDKINNPCFSSNAIEIIASEVIDYFKVKPDYWMSTQTVSPKQLTITSKTDHSITLSWPAIDYTKNKGGYEIYYSECADDSYTLYNITSSKTDEQMTINGLSANKTYYFKVRSVTYPHTDTTETWYERNPNTVYSKFTQEINAKTLSVFVERLFLKLPQTVFEKQNIIQNVQVYIQNTQYENVLISLATNTSGLTYPQTVTIPKGMTSTYFDIGILDNNKIGSQKVVFTASAPDYISAVSSITIIDDDDAPIHPPHKIYAASNGNQRVLITWPVQFGSDHLTYDVYRSDTKDGYYIQINPFPVYNPITIDGQYVHTFYDSELIYNTTYWYKVKTIRYGIYESELSQPISVIPKPHPGAGDFKLVVLEPYQTLTAGQNAIFNISVIAEDHFNQEITLSASSNVLNTSLFNLNQSIVQPDTSTQLNVMIPVNIHPQKYEIKVNAISNCCSHSKEIIINVVYPNSGDSLITTILSSNLVGLNNEVDIQGKIVPNVQNKTPYFIHIKQPDSDKWHTYNQFTENNSQFKFTYQPQHIGKYHIKSSWNGNNFLTPCESKEIVLNVGKGVSKIFCSTDKQDISPNDLIQLQAEILPQQEGMPVFIKVKKPDNSIEMIENMFTNHQGMVTTNFQLSSQTGMWQFTAYWPGNHQYIGAQSFPLSIYPGIETGQALIIAGSGIAHNPLWTTTERLANKFYTLLKNRRFTHDQITYFSDHSFDYDYNGDGEPEIMIDDHDPEYNDVYLYLLNLYENLPKPKVSKDKALIIYMTGHGGQQRFKINAGHYLSATDMDDWLDKLQESTQCTIVLIIDTCKSGSFIDKLKPEAGQKRILISSSKDDEYAMFDQGGIQSFSTFLFESLKHGNSIETSFNHAITEMRKKYIFKYQTPVLTQSQDSTIASKFFVGGTSLIGSILPEIINATPNQVIQPGLFTLSTKVKSLEKIQSVWISIIPPYIVPIRIKSYQWGETPLYKHETVQLTDTNYDNEYKGDYYFDYKGTYILTFFVRDNEDNVSSKEIHLTLEDGKQYFYLNDIIYVLKILSGIQLDKDQKLSIPTGITYQLRDVIGLMQLLAN